MEATKPIRSHLDFYNDTTERQALEAVKTILRRPENAHGLLSIEIEHKLEPMGFKCTSIGRFLYKHREHFDMETARTKDGMPTFRWKLKYT